LIQKKTGYPDPPIALRLLEETASRERSW
jgi:hypothetical protein